MATMFGADATQLQGASGAGTAPLAPVQSPAWQDKSQGLTRFFSGMVDSYIDFEKSNTGAPIWEAQRNEYQAGIATLQQQLQTAGDRHSRTQILTAMKTMKSKFLAEGSHFGIEYAKAIHDTTNYLGGMSGTDEAQQEATAAQDQQVTLFNEMASYGMVVPQNPTDAQLGYYTEAVNSYKAAEAKTKQMDEEFERQRKRIDAGQKDDDFTIKMMEHKRREMAYSVMQDYQQAFGSEILAKDDEWAEKAKSWNWTELKAEIEADFIARQNKIRSAFITTPQVMETQLQMLNILQKSVMDQYDPVVLATTSADVLKARKNTAILSVWDRSGNSMDTLVGVRDLVGDNVFSQVHGSLESGRLLRDLAQAKNSATAPSLTSNQPDPVLAGESMKALSGKIQDINAGKVADKDTALDTVAGPYRSYLRSLNNLPPGISMDLSKALTGFATPEFGQLVKEGRIPLNERQAAVDALQNTYMRSVASGSQEYLLSSPTSGSANNAGDGGAMIARLVEFRMNSNGQLVPHLNPDPTVDWSNTPYHNSMVLRRATKVADQINLGLSVLQNLAADGEEVSKQALWEQTRHLFFPRFFPTPDQVDRAIKERGWNGSGFIHNRGAFTQPAANNPDNPVDD